MSISSVPEFSSSLDLAAELGSLVESQNTIQSLLRQDPGFVDVLSNPQSYQGGGKEISLQKIYEQAGISIDFTQRNTQETEKYISILRDNMNTVLAEVGLEVRFPYGNITDNDTIRFAVAESKVQLPESEYQTLDKRAEHSNTVMSGKGIRARIARLLVPAGK